jgi:hypothetical protein
VTPPAAPRAPGVVDAADVLRSLVDAADAGRLTLAWALATTQDGDPVPAAWAACRVPAVLRAVLRLTRHPAATGGYGRELYCETRPDSPWCARFDACARCCDTIRALVPALTLADVLASARGPA